VTPDQLLSWMQLGVAVATLLGFGKSWFNGTVRAALDAVERIPSIESKVDDQAEEMKDTRDAVIALSYGQQHDSVEVDPRDLSEKLRDDDDRGPEQFLQDRDAYARHATDDDQEA